jgi:redox-sensitive bicupin YhaK (pirin superfamily)
MIALRKSADRGYFDHGWLQSHHTFSFADYYDPQHIEFRALRVMNEDVIAPGQGFGMHGHRDMEIVTLVLEGQLAHRDSLGNTKVLAPGELQRMTAGTGIRHSEFNPSETEPVHLYQIWLYPERIGLTPSYEQKPLTLPEDGWALAAAPPGAGGVLTIHQDARIYVARLAAGKKLEHRLAPGRAAWLQTLRGGGRLEKFDLEAGDGAAITDQDLLSITATTDSEWLLFDLV